MSDNSYNFGKDLVKDAGLDSLGASMRNAYNSVTGGVSQLAGDFKNGISQGASDLMSGAKNIGYNALGAIGRPINAIMDPIEKTVGNAWSGVKSMASNWNNAANQAFKGDANNSSRGFMSGWNDPSTQGPTPKFGAPAATSFGVGPQDYAKYNKSVMDKVNFNPVKANPSAMGQSPAGGLSGAANPLSRVSSMATGSMGNSTPKSPTSMSNNPSPGMKKSAAYRFGAHMVIKKAFEKQSGNPSVDVIKGILGVGRLIGRSGKAMAYGAVGGARGAMRGADVGSRALGSHGPTPVRVVGGAVGGAAGAVGGGVTNAGSAALKGLTGSSLSEAIGPSWKTAPLAPTIGTGKGIEPIAGKIGKNIALGGLGLAGASTVADLIYNANRYVPLPQPRRGYTQVNPYDFRQH